MGTKPCGTCGQSFAESELYYGDDGMVCQQCFGEAEVKSGFEAGYVGPASAALTMALVSWVFNPCGIMTIGTIVAAIQVFIYPTKLDPEDREMVKKKTWVPVAAVLAIGLALMRFVAGAVIGAASTM